MSAKFQLAGQTFMALNGGPHYRFTAAISLFVDCETQEEIDRLTARLCDGGQQEPCGWVKDRFGLSWQLIPSVLGTLMHDPDPAKAGRVMKAMLGMTKLDIAGLERAHVGR
jgi:predicted 3-demethylubiquinone-9 3-methyltransferase (glyoxalase superfamily)